MKSLVSLLALLTLALPVAALQEPSLRELAEKQKKARKGQVKVITEEDLKAGKSRYVPASVDGVAEPPKAEGAQQPAGEAKAEKNDDEIRAEKRAEIEKKIKKENEIIAEAQRLITEAQRELNDVGNYTYGARRAALQKTIDDSNAEIAKCQQTIADLEDQARRLGIVVSK